jgi:Ca2+-binding EF-hand superfamily protein
LGFFCFEDLDRDGSITPVDFEILADKLSSLVGQDDLQKREDYANARKTLCQEIMRADANNDGKVTLGKFTFSISNLHSFIIIQFTEEWLEFHRRLANELRKPGTNPELLPQLNQRINTTFNILDLNHDGHIAREEWVKTCQFFGVDKDAAEKSFSTIAPDNKLEEKTAKKLFLDYIKIDDPNHISNCCLCFL